MRLRGSVVALPLVLPFLVVAAACAPQDSSPSASNSGSPASCAKADLPLLKSGTLTVGTSSPAYPPWFSNNDPTNGKGYESAVAYAVADQLGFSRDEVTWVKVPFNSSYKPGAKNFDFDINQISITPARAKVVDFSDGYYAAAQAVIALKGSKASEATSLADLKDLKLGAQTGTIVGQFQPETGQQEEFGMLFQKGSGLVPCVNEALATLKSDGTLADLE